MKWYYAQGGSQKGPVDDDELRAKIASGEVSSGDLVWREGMKDWVPASGVAELTSYAPPSAPGETGRPIGTAVQTPAVSAAPVRSAPVSPYQTPGTVSAPGGGLQGPIPNYLWQSIVVTILCCWPFGIPAIVFAAKVDGLVARGMYAEAREASEKAKMWAWIAFGSTAVVMVLYILVVVIAGVGSNM